MKDKVIPYPLTIVYDRYNGVYSGGIYLAFNMYTEEVSNIPFDSDDVTCMEYWNSEGKNLLVGKGNTPNESIEDLIEKLEKGKVI